MNPGENMHVPRYHIRLCDFCQALTICLTDPLMVSPAQLTQATPPISGTECSVHWAVFKKKKGSCQHLFPTWKPQLGTMRLHGGHKTPQGHGGKFSSPKQVRLFTGTLSLG